MISILFILSSAAKNDLFYRTKEQEKMIEVQQHLQEKYDHQYSEESLKTNTTELEWRKIGAIGKSRNILDVINHKKFHRVIEVGAGDGAVLKEISKSNLFEQLIAVEISESAIERIKKQSIPNLAEVVRFDGYRIPFEDNEFDLAICSHVMEHVEFPRQLLRELKRISKFQVLEVPIDFSFNVDKKFDHFNAYGHINIYTPGLFRFLLKTEGFQILNEKCAMYDLAAVKMSFQHNGSGLFFARIKRFIWNLFPLLKRVKPNTFTVFTS